MVRKMSRWGWLLLTAIGLLTILFLLGATEFIAQKEYPVIQPTGTSCVVYNDPVAGPHGIPNCKTQMQLAETEFTQYRFNDCGFRTDLPCSPKPAGTFRIVMIGTSFAAGWNVPIEKTYADLLPIELSQMTGRNIQLYNESFPYRFPDLVSKQFDRVLKAQPDLILWTLNEGDIVRQADVELPQVQKNVPQNRLERIERDFDGAFSQGSISQSLASMFTHTRTYNLLAGFIYASPSQYLKIALADPDRMTGYLRTETSPLWQKRYNDFDQDFGSVAAQAKAAGVPIIATLLPNRAEAAMIALGTPPAGYDPFLIDSKLKSIVTSHGETYIAIAPDLRDYPNPQLGFYPTEGHPNDRGHAMFADILARHLAGEISANLQAGNSRSPNQQTP